MSFVPETRIRPGNDAPIRTDGAFVLYWMIAARRPAWNFALDRAIAWARELGKPLVVLEALRVDYRWSSDRHHRFVLEGMAANASAFEKSSALHYPYVETERGAGRGLLETLAARAALVVTDDYPCFFLPRMVASAARKLPVRLEVVDGNGLLPMRSAPRVYPTAFAFRRFLQKELPEHLWSRPRVRPFAGIMIPRLSDLPQKEVMRRWPRATPELLGAGEGVLRSLPVDHGVVPAATPGGHRAAQKALRRFLQERLPRYADQRNQPGKNATSGLSPYLHFGHISVHQVVSELLEGESWTSTRLRQPASGARRGWWGVCEAAEGFLDELVTWRELGFNMAWQRNDFEEFDSLPKWAKSTLAAHQRDRRPYCYSLAELEAASTHDPLWNAAQMQLVREGTIHNYLRMLWGKKILEWSKSPRVALEVMFELNNKYALDGRDPNSANGICWVLGRYDRPWAPERPIFGTVRYMSSENTARKVRVKSYIDTYAPQATPTLVF